jgi:hypothetical protein
MATKKQRTAASGILQKQREPRDGRELLRICRERLAPLWEKRAPKRRKTNGLDHNELFLPVSG